MARFAEVAPGDGTPTLRLLVLQPTPFCNIDCSYCYLRHRTSRARMSLETLDLACRRVFASPLRGSSLDVAWHAGEPLTVPLPWYEQAFDRLGAACPDDLALSHHVQTNGTLMSPAWVRLFATAGVQVGISLDGPADLHDAARRTHDGRGTHAGAMRAVRLLRDGGVAFRVITVLTKAALERPDDLFRFYVENGIREVGFNVEEIEGAHPASSLDGRQVEASYRRFLRRFLELALADPGVVVVREFEEALRSLLSADPVVDEQNQPFGIVTVAHDGAVSTFSPELLDADERRHGSFRFGSVDKESLEEIARTPRFAQVREEVRRGVARCERTCRFFRWCGGGAPANKLAETGRLDGTETMHCRLGMQAVFEEVLAKLEAAASASGRSGPGPAPH